MNKILLVEDNEGDILLTTVMLRDIEKNLEIETARDGEEAIHIIERMGRENTYDHPRLILLDVNLPKRNGFEVLNAIRSNSYLDSIPVVMLTTSSFPKDRLTALENHADQFLTKSSELRELKATIEDIYYRWLSPHLLEKMAS